MNRNEKELISYRIERLLSAEKFFGSIQHFISRREYLETEIIRISGEIDNFHCYQQIDHANNHPSEKKINKLADLKKELKSLDFIWDEWEDLSENRLAEMYESLLNDIWNEYPDQYDLQKQHWIEFKKRQIQTSEINHIQDSLLELLHILQTIIKARASVKGIGVLRYIFGQSPNMVIEAHLHAAHNFIEIFKKELKTSMQKHSNHRTNIQWEELSKQLASLQDHCKTIWNFRHIDNTISESERKLASMLEFLRNHNEENRQEMIKIKKSLEVWLGEVGCDETYNIQ